MTGRPHCQGVKGNGERCGSTLGLSLSGYCLNHDPERTAIAQEMRRAGAKASHVARRANRDAAKAAQPADVPAIPKTLDDAAKYFAWITNAVITGRIDARTGHEAAYSLNGFKAAAEKRDLEKRLTAALARVAELERQPRRAS